MEIDRKLSQRPVREEDVVEFINRELNPVVEKLRLSLEDRAARLDRIFDVTSKSFGASVSKPAATNDEAFQAAADAAEEAGGGIVYVPRGTYSRLAEVTFGSNVVWMGDGPSTIIDFSGVTTQSIGFACRGELGTPVALSSSVSEGGLTLPGTAFGANEWVKVYSEDVTTSTSLKKGEFARINSGTTLFDPLCDTYTTGPRAAAVTHVSSVGFHDMTILGPEDGSVNFSGILFDTARGVHVSGMNFERCHFYGIGLWDSLFASVIGCMASRSESGSLAYGVAILNAAQDVTIASCKGFRLRHLVTHGGFSSRPGVPRRTVTVASVASQCRNSGFDAHAGGEDICFLGNSVYGSESDGITFEAVSGVISGNTIRDSVGPGIHLNPQSTKAFNVSVVGNRVSGLGNAAARSAVQIQVNDGYESFDGITISGNTFLDCRYGIRTINVQTGRIQNVTVSGNTFTRCGADADTCVSIVHAERVTISGNSIYEAVNSVDGISLTDVDNFSVTGNTITLPNSGGCRGIRCLTTSTNGLISGNKVDTGASGEGITLADTATNVTVGINDTVGCPTAFVLGTGSGHVLIQAPAISADRGDNDIALLHRSEQTQLFNTALTSNADITLPSANVRMKFRIVRGAGATGAFNVNIGALKALGAASTWADVESNGSAYILTAAGTL